VSESGIARLSEANKRDLKLGAVAAQYGQGRFRKPRCHSSADRILLHVSESQKEHLTVFSERAQGR